MDKPSRHASLKQIGGLLGGHWAAEIIALTLSTPMALKEIELRPGFHAFGNYSLLQAPADIDHGADNRCVFRVRGDLLYERLMEFQSVGRKAPEISKAGIPGAKIVDGQLHAHGF